VLPYEVPGSGGYRTVPIENTPPDALSLRRGMRIQATDGDAGSLGALVVDIGSGRITHFVLEARRGLGQHELTLPVTAVDYVLGDIGRGRGNVVGGVIGGALALVGAPVGVLLGALDGG